MIKDKPRTGRNADAPGHYDLTTRTFSTVINPGEELELEQYVTGYGQISSAKLICYPSSDIFDEQHSSVFFGMKETSPGSGVWLFGGQEKKLKDPGITIYLTGFQKDGWDEPSLFVDVTDEDNPQILTETKQENAPFSYKLKTKKSVNPGNYSLEFYFTYFNGNTWCGSNNSVQYKVRNIFERHEKIIASLALIVTLSAIIRFVIKPIFALFFN